MVCKLKLIKPLKNGYIYGSIIAVGGLSYTFWTNEFNGFLELLITMIVGCIIVTVGHNLLYRK